MDVFDFGLRLRELRGKRKLSQTEVSERLNVERATISGYERNVTTPSLDMLKKLAFLYNTSTDFILGISDRETIYLDDLSPYAKDGVIRILDEIRNIVEKEKNENE